LRLCDITKMRISDLRFLVSWLFPLLTLLGLWLAPERAFVSTLVVWLGIVAVDALVPGADTSPPALTHDTAMPYFRGILRGYVLLQMGLIGYGGWIAMHSSWWVALGVTFGVGYVSGSMGITFAHELGHSKSKLDRFCAWLLMTSVCYGHFMVEHYRGHHPRAATFDDPASARYGESVYRFWPRTVWGCWVSAWRLEAARMAQIKSSWLRSPLVWSTAASAAMTLAAFYIPNMLFHQEIRAQAAIKLIAFIVLQSVVAFTLLEIVNYIEHYGLQRNAQGGKREAFGLMHAWNADHLATNSMLANLQRHSDHHMHAWKPYPTLQPLPGPQLPTGYAGCILLAMLPPLWFKVMHARLQALQLTPATPMQTAQNPL
jgi:alkane 1-monooxygenase